MPEQLLTQEQVKAVVAFSEGLYSMAQYGVFTPWTQNELLRNLNNNSAVPTIEKIEKALADYKNSEDALQAYTEFMQKWSMIFARTITAYANTLAFDLQIVCKNAYTREDFESKEYQADKARVYKFLDAFDYKAEFRKMIIEMLRHETVFAWFRKTKWGNKGMKLALQLMPQDYCMLTGYWEKGLLYDFNLVYFLQPMVDIDGFDPVFKKYMVKAFGPNANPLDYYPTTPLNDRYGQYAYWTQTSPEDGAVVFKMQPNTFDNTPYLAPLLKSTLRDEEIADLQYNKDVASAFGILAGEIRLFDNAKDGTKANQFSIDPRTLGEFMGKVRAGLPSEVKLAAMPTENTKFYQYTDNNTDMLSSQLSSTAGQGSGVSRVIYSSDRQSNAELQYAAENDYHTMEPLYYQFNNFLDFWVNKLTKRFKFKCFFSGCSYEYDRNARMNRLMKMADKGIVLNSSAYASVLGMRPQDFERSLIEGHNSDFLNNLSMLMNANTTANAGVGRPRVNDTQISDSGEASREDLM